MPLQYDMACFDFFFCLIPATAHAWDSFSLYSIWHAFICKRNVAITNPAGDQIVYRKVNTDLWLGLLSTENFKQNIIYFKVKRWIGSLLWILLKLIRIVNAKPLKFHTSNYFMTSNEIWHFQCSVTRHYISSNNMSIHPSWSGSQRRPGGYPRQHKTQGSYTLTGWRHSKWIAKLIRKHTKTETYN